MRFFLIGATAVLSLTAGAALSFQALRPAGADRLDLQIGPSPTLAAVEARPEVKATARVTASGTPEQSEAAVQHDVRPAPLDRAEKLPEQAAIDGSTEPMPPTAVLTAFPQPAIEAPVDEVPEGTASVSKGPGRLVIQHASASAHRTPRPSKVADKPVPVASPAEPAGGITEALLERANR